MARKLIGTIAAALGLLDMNAHAAVKESVYLRDSEQGTVELSNVPQGQGYRHLLDATVPATPQAPAAAQPATRPATYAAQAAAKPADAAPADDKDADKEKDKDKLADGSDPLYTGGYASSASSGGGSGGGSGGATSAVTVPRALPGTDLNAAMAQMSVPIDPALATQLQQYRALMLQQVNPSTGLAENPARTRRYLMMDRATYQARVPK